MSNIKSDPERWLDELPEPNALTPEEFHAWRGLIRLREYAMREIDRRLQEHRELSLADYGVLITLVTQPQLRLRMSDLGAQRMLTPSGITRGDTLFNQPQRRRRQPARVLTPADTPKTDSISGRLHSPR